MGVGHSSSRGEEIGTGYAERRGGFAGTSVGAFLLRCYGQRRRTGTVAAVFLALAVGYHVIFGQNGLTAYEKKQNDASSLEQEARVLAEENQRLRAHVGRLQNDPEAIEQQAREDLRYTRPGEVIVTMPDQK